MIHYNLQKKVDLVSLKSDVDELNIKDSHKLKYVPYCLNNLKSDDNFYITKLKSMPIDLKKNKNFLKNKTVKNRVWSITCKVKWRC